MGMGGMGGMMMGPPNPFGGLQTYQPQLQPMYSQPQQMGADHAQMEAAFEQALADARAQTAPAKEELKEAEQKEEIKEPVEDKGGVQDSSEFKGDLEAVWESLKPEAERINKLAEWEKEFSQVSHDEPEGLDLRRVRRLDGGCLEVLA